MARYIATQTGHQCIIIADTANANRPVQDPERGGPMVWDVAEDALAIAARLNNLETIREIVGLDPR